MIPAVSIRLRGARTSDVKDIRALVAPLADERVLIAKEAVAYYEGLQEFVVAEREGEVVGCGALHVMWDDLAEVRTLAVSPKALGQGVGHELLCALVERARSLDVGRLFCLTFEVDFFVAARVHGDRGNPCPAGRLRRAPALP